MSSCGLIEENMELSHIHLAVICTQHFGFNVFILKVIYKTSEYMRKVFLKHYSHNTLVFLINGHARSFFSRKKPILPADFLVHNRLKIPHYPPVLRVGWIFHPTRLFQSTRTFIREERVV